MGIFGNFGEGLNKKEPDKKDNYDENYIIGVMDIPNSRLFFVLSTGRRKFAKLLESLPTDKYMVIGVQMLQNVEEYADIMKRLMEENKPEDLEFGEEE